MPVTLQPTMLKYKDGQTFVSADCLKGDPGSPGDPTQLIDDTAGSGDTDKTWSADKLSSKADIANPNFTGSISMGRVANTTVGEKSTATGNLVTASGPNSNAEGYGTTASGNSSHAEGNQTFAVGDYSHSQGYGTMANGDASSVEGNGTVANGANSSVSGMYNVPDSYANWQDWAPNTYYAAGAKVHIPDEEPDDPRGEYFVCNTSHTSGSAWITYSFYWDSDNGKMNYAQIVGNGSNYLQQSNAYTLDWNGNGSYAGDVTINKGTVDEVSVSELKTEINSKYEKPNTGIPSTDLASAVQNSLGKADTAYQIPSGGIPASDIEAGAITMPKLNSNLKNVVVVQLDTEKDSFHNVTPISVSFYPDERISSVTAKYTNSKNAVKGKYKTGTENGVVKTVSGNMLTLSGTATSQVNCVRIIDSDEVAEYKGKTFNVYVYLKKSTPWEKGNSFVLYDGVSWPINQWLSKTTSTMIGWKAFTNITINENATQVTLKFDDAGSNVFAEGDFIWIGMYETEAIDTNQTVTGDEPYTISLSGLSCVDTMIHESTAKYIESTKEYVENHIPDIKAFWTEEIYVLPEKFGAVGDGVADDTQAISDCISYAKTYGKAVKGFNKYKTTGTIVLDGRYLDVYLNEINYTGNGAAVSLQHNNIIFGFHRITSSNVGIAFEGSSNYARLCQVTGNEISSTGNCIELGDMTFYCTCEVRFLSSSNSNCIYRNYVSTFGGGEFVFRSSSCHCPNGYVVYNVGSGKFYDFTVEGDCKYGLYNPSGCLCVGWRHREQTDGMTYKVIQEDESYNNGALITFTQQPNGQGLDAFRYISTDPIPWYSIDLSAVEGYESIPTGQDSIEEWHKLSYTGIDIGITIRGVGATRLTTFGNKTYFIGGNLVCVPEHRKICEFEQAEYDLTLYGSADAEDIRTATSYELAKAWATDFVTEYSHTDLYLNASYGAIGYNDITLTQKDGNTATIYDKMGNVLFDGTNAGNGKWSMKCYIDRSSMGRYEGSSEWWCYDGTNEKWEITKLE